MKKLFNTMFGALALVGVSTSVAMAAETNSTYGIPASQYSNGSEEYDLDNLVIKDNEEWDSSNPNSPQFYSYLLVSETYIYGDGYLTLSEIKEMDFEELNESLSSEGLSFKIEVFDFSDVENIKLISTEKYNEFNADNFDNNQENLRFSIVVSEKY